MEYNSLLRGNMYMAYARRRDNKNGKLWMWRKVLNILWSDKTIKEVLRRIGEERAIMKIIHKRQRAWLGHTLRRCTGGFEWRTRGLQGEEQRLVLDVVKDGRSAVRQVTRKRSLDLSEYFYHPKVIYKNSPRFEQANLFLKSHLVVAI